MEGQSQLSKSRSNSLHRGYKYKHWRDTVLQNGYYKCSVCASGKNLTADHIKPASTHPELFFDPNNGRILCDKCRVKDMLERWANNRFKNGASIN